MVILPNSDDDNDEDDDGNNEAVPHQVVRGVLQAVVDNVGSQ